MKRFGFLLWFTFILISCGKKEVFKPRVFSEVVVETIIQDSLLDVRAMEVMFDSLLLFPYNRFNIYSYNIDANNGFRVERLHPIYPVINKQTGAYIKTGHIDSKQIRSIASNKNSFFVLNIESPAIINKVVVDTVLHANYRIQKAIVVDSHPNAFYDSMEFWNDNEGIAIGDSTNGCLSVIITRDGGNSWHKLECDNLPEGLVNEGAFAASDTNIAIVGNNTWVATTAGRVYYSPDKGITWEVYNTPIVNENEADGIYSIHFYDELNGFAIGGNYEQADSNHANKIRSQDGGKTWQLVAQNQNPGYRSCVQYIPNREGKELVVVGFKGVDYSNDSGNSWKHLSNQGFYTLRFISDSVAYAGGNGRVSKLTFR